MTKNILRIDASARYDGSVSRDLGDHIIARFADAGATQIETRDLADALQPIDEDWINANFTPADERSSKQKEKLRQSDGLVEELQAADILLIAMPIYNFGVPSSLKTWVDMVARAGVTFRYTESGPEGLLEGKRAIVAVASGGTEVGSDVDFATGYVRHVLGFIGITDVIFVSADRIALDPEATVSAAHDAIERLPLAA